MIRYVREIRKRWKELGAIRAQFGDLAEDGNEDKLVSKLDVLKGCVAVYCQAAGASGPPRLLSSLCASRALRV